MISAFFPLAKFVSKALSEPINICLRKPAEAMMLMKPNLILLACLS